MNRSLALIIGSILLALLAGIVNFEILPDPAVTIATEDGDMQLLVYFFFLAISLTFATLFICLSELFQSLQNRLPQIRILSSEKES